MPQPVLGSRALARVNAKTIVPEAVGASNASVAVGRTGVRRPPARHRPSPVSTIRGVRLDDTMPLPEYANSPETVAAPGDST